ncbi:hypothetical protein EPO44_10615, partial [bacterium]
MMNPVSFSVSAGVLKPLSRIGRRSFRLPFDYLRARKILRDYAAHYRNAHDLFIAERNPVQMPARPFSENRVCIVGPGRYDSIIELPKNYFDLVARVRDDVQARLEESRQCLFFPKLKMQAVPEHTKDIPSVKRGEVIAIQLKQYLDIDGLEGFCSSIMKELEQKIYQSYVIVDKVYVYRSLPTSVEEQVSWLWHYDNHPNEILKVMVYLTDVSDRSGPFEYFRLVTNHYPLFISPKPLLGYSRISPKIIERYLLDGYEASKVTGPVGTVVVFDNNVLHRATIPKGGYRDVVVLQVRPAAFRPAQYVDSRWTGSFQQIGRA